MTKYGLHGSLRATAGQGEALAQILLDASRLLAQAEGCQLYLVSRDSQQEELVWITEGWDTKAHHDNSLQFAGVRELIGKAIPLLVAPPQKSQELQVLGGKGLS